MPRLPRYEARVTTDPLRPPSARAPGDTGVGALAKGVAQVGQGIGQVAVVADKFAQEEEARQIAAFEVERERKWTELFHADGGGDEAKAGLRHRIGERAYEAGVDQNVQAEIEKFTAEALGRIPSPRARAIAQARNTNALDAYKRDIVNHVAQQRHVAKAATARATEETALDAIALNHTSRDEISRHTIRAEGVLRAMAPSREAGDAAVADLRKKADMVVLNRYLATEDADGASTYFAQAKERLGADAERFEKAIGSVARAKQADTLTTEILDLARDPVTGWVRSTDAVRLLEGGGSKSEDATKILSAGRITDPALRKEVSARLRERLSLAEEERESEIRGVFGEANTAFTKGGYRTSAIPRKTRDWLIERAPEEWQKFEEESRRRHPARGKGAAGKGGTKQSNLNLIAKQKYLAMPIEERTKADLDAMFLGTGPDEIGMGALRVLQRRDLDSVEKGHAVGEGEFRREAMANIGALKKDDRKEFEALVTATYGDFVEQHKRKPSIDEKTSMLDALVAKELEEGWFNNSEVPAWKRLAEEREARRSGTKPAPATPTDEQREQSLVNFARNLKGGVAPKPAKLDRAKTLRASGKSNAEIAATLTEEGY